MSGEARSVKRMTTIRVARLPPLVLAAVVGTFVTAAASATSVTLDVPGVSDVWLAGQPDGTILSDGYPSDDVAPANSPVLASTGLSLAAGSPLTFVVTGIVDYGGCAPTSPDGDDGCGILSAREFFGISTYVGPINALVGVFLDDSVPSGAAPAGLDFSTRAEQSQPGVAPLLNQVFFIGDGLTGTGSGSVQQFRVPAGATRLFLGSSDGPGANYNNTSSYSVTVSDDVSLHRSDVTMLAPHTPPRDVVYLVPPTAEDLSISGPVYQHPFGTGDLERDGNALGNGVPLCHYQVNRPLTTLELSKSGTTILFLF
jgi:hypothetical protein